MIFQKKKSERNMFALSDDDVIGTVFRGEEDSGLDDSISGRGSAEQFTGSYVGNFAARRARRVGIFLLSIVFGILLLRVGNWQILHGDDYRTTADNNRTRIKTVIANRGVVTDRNGVLLAWNTPTFHLVVNRKDIPEKSEDRVSWFTNLATTLRMSTDSWEEEYQHSSSSDQTVLLSEDVPYTTALAFLSRVDATPGVTVELAPRRSYITNAIPTLSHVLGYTGTLSSEAYDAVKDLGYRRFDITGKQGLEKQYESDLRGTPGTQATEVNAQGKVVRTLKKVDAVNGKDLVLSLDSGFTAAIENILTARLATATAKRAAVVVTNPQNGEVLALVSYPSYDANLFTDGISQTAYSALLNDPNAPLFPRAYQGEYPAGSTIKPIYASAALMEKIITPATSFLSVGGLWLGNRFFPDWRAGGHGFTNVYHAIADSVNTFFYIIGGGNEAIDGLGLERLMQYAKLFGLSTKTGIDLGNEADGFLPTKAWKEETKGEPWYVGDTYNVSIGQGDVLVTPLQMNRTTMVFANGGNLITPHLLKDVPVEETKILPDDILEIVRDAMRQTITNGSATSLQAVPVPVAGKTGTAQWATGRVPHSWFTGFAPYDNPTVCITVVVEEGGDQAFAIPIAREVLTWYFTNRGSI